MEKGLSCPRQEAADDDDIVDDQAGQRAGPPLNRRLDGGSGPEMPLHGGFIDDSSSDREACTVYAVFTRWVFTLFSTV